MEIRWKETKEEKEVSANNIEKPKVSVENETSDMDSSEEEKPSIKPTPKINLDLDDEDDDEFFDDFFDN